MSETCPTAPSSASVCGLFDGAPGAWPKFIAHWGLRSLLILPGYAAVGVRGKQLFLGALGSSTMISLFLMLFTAVSRGRRGIRNGHHNHLKGATRRRALAARPRRRRPVRASAKLLVA